VCSGDRSPITRLGERGLVAALNAPIVQFGVGDFGFAVCPLDALRRLGGLLL
jgi:hypothetical protein